jgi:hypothetical protein
MTREEFIEREEQIVVANLWSARNAVTVDDMDFLADLKVDYGDCCGLESNCPPAIRIERACIYCGKPADSLGYCENMRRFMECEPKIFPGDRAFLASCGIAPFNILPAQGTVTVKIEMGREFVLKYKKNRNRKAVRRRRESSSRPKMGEYAV